MAISARLDLRQSQSLVMTPQLQQAIKLLQLSNLDLAAYVETQLEENPLLVRDEGEGDDARAGTDAESGGADADAEPATPDSADMAAADGIAQGDDAPLDTDYDDRWESDAAGGGAADTTPWGSGGRRDGETNLEQILERPRSLRDHVLDQIEMDLDDPADRIIAAHLVDMLDDAGYVTGDLAEVGVALGCSTARVEAVLEKLQHLDPPGIFARDLGECLALQLKERDRLDPAMQALIDNLDLLARRERAALMKKCGVDAEDLADMVAEVRALDPKPALAFDVSVAQPVIPDVIMRAQNGRWAIELNSETLPRVLVDGRYHARVSRGARDKGEQTYIAECLQTANWLVKALHQRATTILRVATEIVRQQDGFFSHGVQHLKPLVLRNIAEAIEMHESTVSRVTSNKYIATPRGIFELKYFFTSAIAGRGVEEVHSAEAVRHRIKALIDAESPGAVLSDDAIADVLNAAGLDIARRTVAKYRESMRIPSSVQRRREKSMPL